MALDYVQNRAIAIGYDCYVRLGTSATDAKIIGFTQSYTLNETFQTKTEYVIGLLTPVAKDVIAYDCKLTLAGLVPSKRGENFHEKLAHGGYDFNTTLIELAPNVEDFLDNGVITKYPYMDFIEKSMKFVVCQVEGITVGNSTITVQSQDYVKCNLSLEALVAKKFGIKKPLQP